MSALNRVWIELELPPRDEPQKGHDRAAALSKVLNKVGVDYKGYPPVWFDERKWRYAFTHSSAGSFYWGEDNGHWFNLDHLDK